MQWLNFGLSHSVLGVSIMLLAGCNSVCSPFLTKENRPSKTFPQSCSTNPLYNIFGLRLPRWSEFVFAGDRLTCLCCLSCLACPSCLVNFRVVLLPMPAGNWVGDWALPCARRGEGVTSKGEGNRTGRDGGSKRRQVHSGRVKFGIGG